MAERPSPHSIAVCTLIALQSDPASPCLSGASSRQTEAHLSNLLQRLLLSSDTATGLQGTPLTELLRLVAGEDGSFTHAADALLQDLMQSCASVDALEDLFGALEASVVKGRVDGNSAHGIYVRKHCLGFNLLPFESVVRLWTALREYVDQHSSSTLTSIQLTPYPQWPPSVPQILVHLVAQCRSMQLLGGTLPFEVIEHLLQQVLRTYPELIVVHFLRYLNCYFHDEKGAASDHLHRYFDYAMIIERKERLTNGAISTALQNSRNIVQYAPILLGTLFHRFGQFSLARKATEEALRIAQQTGDGACMAYALAWLHATTLTSTHPTTSTHYQDPSLRQASQRALQLPLQSLFVGTCLQQAQYLLDHGAQPTVQTHHKNDFNVPVDFSVFLSSQTSRVIPALAWDHLAAATAFELPLGSESALYHPSSNHSTSSTAFFADMPCHISNLGQSRDVFDTLIHQRFKSASLWIALGHFQLSHLQARLCFDSYDELVSTDQASDAALQSIARVRYGPGLSFSYLSFLDNSRSNLYSGDKISDTINLYCRCFIQNEWSMYQGDWPVTKSYQRILHSSLPALYKYGIEYLVDAMGSTALLYIRQKLYDRANTLLDKLCQYCEQHSFHSRHAYYLLQKGLMYISIQHPIRALPSVLSCLSLCDAKMLDSMHAAALSSLARIFYEMDNIKRSTSILKAVLPLLIQHGMIWFVGEAWLTLAKCALAEKDNDPSTAHDTDFEMALSHLCQAEKSFVIMDDTERLREIYYLKSIIYHQLGKRSKRNLEAQRFHEIKLRMNSYYYPKWVDDMKIMIKNPI